ncbi:serine/threonine-protein phosphatase 2A 55 kDaregulatory subunit B [Striga asiatica]|uniref:Serine/threonine-protein phosphatase 2A 55 kDaregulatory subunit B n=1 Tax=Striga asiatica TaxID=4170 RepID=A0A5A7R4J4_STRAF|nr:serine/threonine-protein phosphatase 2A 55 kDaregulatory subunit B [Striga asiatica]
MGSSDGGEVASAAAGSPSPLEWKFSQVFGERAAGKEVQEGAESPGVETNKLLHLAWHPSENLIGCAAANSLYIRHTKSRGGSRGKIPQRYDGRRSPPEAFFAGGGQLPGAVSGEVWALPKIAEADGDLPTGLVGSARGGPNRRRKRLVAASGRDRVRRKPQFTREQGSPEFFARWRRRWAATHGVGGERVVALLGSRRRGLATGSDQNSQVHAEDTRWREARGVRFAENSQLAAREQR